MTKTLTEQWREGTLEQRYYYVKYPGNGQKPFVEIELKNFLLDLVKVKDSDKIEVLAPVPSYEKVKEMSQKIERLEFDNEALEISRDELEKKLKIATKALKKLTRDCNKWGIARKALKEMEGVK